MTTNLPAYLQTRQTAPLAENLASHLGTGAPPYLSIAGNRFTKIDATGAEEPLQTFDAKLGVYADCIIIDALERLSKVFYNKPFDPNSAQYEPPACFSDNGVGPSRNASSPQSTTCAACPNSAWGSKISAVSGKGVKACSDQQKLALMFPGDDVIFLLRVPPNSLSQLRNYIAKFNGQQIDVSDVVTRISFEQGGVGTLRFDAVNYIDEASFQRREKLRTAKATDMLVGRNDLPRQETLPPPQQAPQIIAPPAAPLAATPVLPQSPLPLAAPPPQAAIMPLPAGGVPTVSPTEQPRRRQRRTAQAAPAQPTAQAPTQPPMAPFRPEVAPAPVAAPVPAGNSQAGGFGMQQAAPMTSDLEATLNGIFGPAPGQ